MSSPERCCGLSTNPRGGCRFHSEFHLRSLCSHATRQLPHSRNIDLRRLFYTINCHYFFSVKRPDSCNTLYTTLLNRSDVLFCAPSQRPSFHVHCRGEELAHGRRHAQLQGEEPERPGQLRHQLVRRRHRAARPRLVSQLALVSPLPILPSVRTHRAESQRLGRYFGYIFGYISSRLFDIV